MALSTLGVYVTKLYDKFFESSLSKAHLLLRMPLCFLFGAILFVEAIAYFTVRAVVIVLEFFLARRASSTSELHAKRRSATTFEEYHAACKEVDESEGRGSWRRNPRSQHYDSTLLISLTKRLHRLRTTGKLDELMHTLTFGRNTAGMMNLDLYTKAWSGGKYCITEYVDEVVRCTEMISTFPIDPETDPILFHDRRRFFLRARTEYGNTCLLLSGGAMLGLYHFGIIKALIEQNILPKIISGASAGAVVGSYIAARSDEEILKDLNDPRVLSHKFGPLGPFWGGRIFQMYKAFTSGVVYDIENFHTKILWFTKNLTFLEVYKRTGRVLNISCTPNKTSTVKRNPPVMLNYITSPHVPVAYAVMASSCVPLLMHPVVLMERVRDEHGAYIEIGKGEYKERPFMGGTDGGDLDEAIGMRDGSFESDIPVMYMGRVFDGHFNIVSQVNPHVVPFFFNNTGEAGRPLRSWNSKGGWRGGFLLSLSEMWLKEDMRKNVRILSAMRLLVDVMGVDWGALWLQDSMGDLTITPKLTLSDLFNISKNLQDGPAGRQQLSEMIRKSELKAWHAIPMLLNRMRIQNALEKADLLHNTENLPAMALLAPELAELESD